MKKLFVFSFENSKKIFCRKYTFDMDFRNESEYEQALDWAEMSGEVESFTAQMEQYGNHEISFDPSTQFYGLSSYNTLPKNYIKVMESWKDFFIEHDINCGDIVEVIEDRTIA